MERETYIRLLLIQKASDLGIHVGVDAAALMANQMLRFAGTQRSDRVGDGICETGSAA